MSDHETTDDAPPELSPTVRPDARGTAVVAGGEVWILADYLPVPEPVCDALYDDNALAGRYDESHLLVAAVRLLLACHDVPVETAADVAASADRRAVVAAVEAAMLGPEETHRTWSGWVTASLWSNGIDPDSVPPADRREVLDMLVATGRALPASKWVSSAEAAKVRADLMALVKP